MVICMKLIFMIIVTTLRKYSFTKYNKILIFEVKKSKFKSFT
jgi:hypothetical protein